jgi:hypothetical protein
MGAEEVRLDDHRIVGVVEGDQLVALVREGGAGLLEVPRDLLRPVVDIACADQLVARMVERLDGRLVLVAVLELHMPDDELLARPP